MDTASQALDIAERLAQTRGFNGFSYADIAAELGITKASLHHHFPAKADLGVALMDRYARSFEEALSAIDRGGGDAYAKLCRYAKLYEDVLNSDRLCLCGMLAAEYSTLPKEMQHQIQAFFVSNEEWVSRRIEEGRKAKLLHSGAPARDVARMLVGALEGAMLLARSHEDATLFPSAIKPFLAGLRSVPARRTAA